MLSPSKLYDNSDGYYNSIALAYNALHSEEQYRKMLEISKHFLPINLHTSPKVPFILDIGTGTGVSSYLTKLLFQGNCISFGSDPASQLLSVAVGKIDHLRDCSDSENSSDDDYLQPEFQKCLLTDVICQPAEISTFSDCIFDFIISLTAIQNFSDMRKSFQEMKRISKKSATFILTILKKQESSVSLAKKLCQEILNAENTHNFVVIDHPVDILFLLSPQTNCLLTKSCLDTHLVKDNQ